MYNSNDTPYAQPLDAKELCFYTGMWGMVATLFWICCYTVPRWDAVVTEEVAAASGDVRWILLLYASHTLNNAVLEALVGSLPPTLTMLDLEHCTTLGRIPDLSPVPKLETLLLTGCRTLHTMPELGWDALTSLQKIDLFGCKMLKDQAIARILHGMTPAQFDQVTLLMPNGKIMA